MKAFELLVPERMPRRPAAAPPRRLQHLWLRKRQNQQMRFLPSFMIAHSLFVLVLLDSGGTNRNELPEHVEIIAVEKFENKRNQLFRSWRMGTAPPQIPARYQIGFQHQGASGGERAYCRLGEAAPDAPTKHDADGRRNFRKSEGLVLSV